MKVNYNAIAENPSSNNYKLCRKATSLHAEECKQTNLSAFCSSTDTSQNTYSSSDKTKPIIYGFLRDSTKDLVRAEVGVAFDCDLNKDGIYDQVSERFYYVSPLVKNDLGDYRVTYKEGDVTRPAIYSNMLDQTTAVLIYYTNTKQEDGNVVNSKNAPIAYHTGDTNSAGPVTAVSYLPTINQWQVGLTNNIRNLFHISPNSSSWIPEEKLSYATKIESSFNYSIGNTKTAARLLTVQEIVKGCATSTFKAQGIWNNSSLDHSCRFLLENTGYATQIVSDSPTVLGGYWLENGNTATTNSVWFVSSYSRALSTVAANNGSSGGVRPAIEVKFDNLSY